MKFKYLLALLLASQATYALAWDGTNSATGDSVEIGKGNLVRPGQEIEIYDYGTGGYRSVTVESINSGFGSVDVEVYDSESGEYMTLEMDDN